MNMGERLKELRLKKGVTQEEVGNFLGVAKATIMKYEKGLVENLKRSSIEKLAKYFNVTPSYLMCLEEETPKNNNKQVFPLLGTVKAGYDYLAIENIIGYIAIEKNIPDPEDYFALKVTGDSMQPILYENDIIVVHKQNDVENGQVAIIILGEEATVKKVVKYDDYIELVAFNSYYPPKKIYKNDDFKIIGKVTEARITKIFE